MILRKIKQLFSRTGPPKTRASLPAGYRSEVVVCDGHVVVELHKPGEDYWWLHVWINPRNLSDSKVDGRVSQLHRCQLAATLTTPDGGDHVQVVVKDMAPEAPPDWFELQFTLIRPLEAVEAYEAWEKENQN